MNRRKLKGKMAEAEKSQKELAKLLGISLNAFNNKVNGKSEFNTSEVTRLCAILDNISDAEKIEIFLT